jgi:hypothetical protein
MALARLHLVPAVVVAAFARRRLEVDLLPMVLTDVGDEQIARPLVERELVRITQAVGPDLRLDAAHLDLREIGLADPE